MKTLTSLSGFPALLNLGGNIVIPKTSGEAALSIIREGAMIDLVILEHKVTIDDTNFLAGLKQLVPSVPLMVIMSSTTPFMPGPAGVTG